MLQVTGLLMQYAESGGSAKGEQFVDMPGCNILAQPCKKSRHIEQQGEMI